jgi:hypothetical protein
MASKGASLMPAILGLVALCTTLSILVVITNGEVGLRKRRGRVILRNGLPINVYPGWCLRFLFWGVERVDVRSVPVTLDQQTGTTKDGISVLVRGVGNFCIAASRKPGYAPDDPDPKAWEYGDNVRRFRYATTNTNEAISVACKVALLDYVSSVTYDQLLKRENLLGFMRSACAGELLKIGLRVDTFGLADRRSTDSQQQADAIRSLAVLQGALVNHKNGSVPAPQDAKQ